MIGHACRFEPESEPSLTWRLMWKGTTRPLPQHQRRLSATGKRVIFGLIVAVVGLLRYLLRH